MFERFTDRCRKVMALANQHAHRWNHEYIGTEHLLLALIDEGSGVGATALRNIGVDLVNLRGEVERSMKDGSYEATVGKLPQTARAKKIIECAINEARELNCNYIGTEHILLGILVEGEGHAAQALKNAGGELDVVRAEVRRLLDAAAAQTERLLLFRIHHGAESFWVESTDVKAANDVWKRHFWKVPPGMEQFAQDPDSIEQVSDGPVWR